MMVGWVTPEIGTVIANRSKNLIRQRGAAPQIELLNTWCEEMAERVIEEAEAVEGETCEGFAATQNVMQSLPIWRHRLPNHFSIRLTLIDNTHKKKVCVLGACKNE